MTNTRHTILVIALLIFGIGSVWYVVTVDTASKTENNYMFSEKETWLPPLDESFDWRKALAQTDWQLTRAMCSDDNYYKNNGFQNCRILGAQFTHDDSIHEVRSITYSEQQLCNYISRVAYDALPKGHAVVRGGTYGVSRSGCKDVWVEDLNSDGIKEMIILGASSKTILESSHLSTGRDRSQDVLLVVTPLDITGKSRSIANLSWKEAEEILPEFAVDIASIEGTMDFNHNGEKELVMPAPFNEPVSYVFVIDYDTGTFSPLKYDKYDQAGSAIHIGSASTATAGREFVLKDLNNDSADEYIIGGTSDTVSDTYAIKEIEVYEWNGEIFEHSPNLTEELKLTFNPETDQLRSF
jgi:hypothetical protein